MSCGLPTFAGALAFTALTIDALDANRARWFEIQQYVFPPTDDGLYTSQFEALLDHKLAHLRHPDTWSICLGRARYAR